MPTATSFEFGRFRVEPEQRRLLRDGVPIALTPKAFELLVILVEQPGQLLRKETLIARLWPGVFVEEVNLAQNVSVVRRALGGASRQAYVQTVAGAGYRFVADVRAVTPAGSPPPIEQGPPSRVLVLPFRMLKPDAELDFLAFSLPDALTASLSGLDSVVVRSSLVAARFAGDTPDLRRIAREASVDLVVSGTLLRAGDELRVTAQLADAVAGTLVWSHTAQAPVGDLFRLQDSLVARVADSLSAPLTDRDRRQLRRDVPASAKTYEYFLRGNQASLDGQTWSVARDLYRQAVEEDPQYAPAWARLARIYRLLGKYRIEERSRNLEQADEALRRALAINPDLAFAQHLHAQIEVDRGHAQAAMVQLLERARDRPGDAESFAALVQACRFCGLYRASVAAHAEARRLDPSLVTGVMHTYYVMREYESVLTSYGVATGYVYLLSLVGLDRLDEAGQVLKQIERRGHRTPELVIAARELIAGRNQESASALDQASAVFADPEAWFYAARHYAHLGERARAIDALTRAIAGGYFCYAPLVDDPWFEPLRADPAFVTLAGRARTGHDAAAAAFHAAGGGAILSAGHPAGALAAGS